MATQRSNSGWLLRGLVGLASLALSAGRAAACHRLRTAGGETTRTSEGGQVTGAVTWERPSARMRTIRVAMATHAVDLDGYDLGQLATPRTDDARELRPLGCDGPTGGHHRGGTLTFPVAAADAPLLAPDTRAVELVLRDVAGVPERRFEWPV